MRDGIEGRGLFTDVDVKTGELVMEYKGMRIVGRDWIRLRRTLDINGQDKILLVDVPSERGAVDPRDGGDDSVFQ